MMTLIRRFIFLLCASYTISAYVYLGGDPIHRRSRVDNHGRGEQQRQTGIPARVHSRSGVPVAAARRKPVVRRYQNVNTKRQLFPRRPVLNTKRQLFPRGPLLNSRGQFLPQRPLLNLKRQLFPRRPLVNTRRQLFPRRPLLSARRPLFPRRPLINPKRQLFLRRPLLSSRRHVFPRRPLINSNRQLASRRTLLNTRRQLFPRTPLLNTKAQLFLRRPLLNRKRQLFPRRPLLNPKSQLLPRRPLFSTKRQLFPRIPFIRPQPRTLSRKPKYGVPRIVPGHITKTHIPIFHNNANSAELRSVRPRPREIDRFPWKSYAEVKAPAIDIFTEKKSRVIRKPNQAAILSSPRQRKVTILSSPRQRPRSNVPNSRARIQSKNDIPRYHRASVAWAHNGVRFHERPQYGSIGGRKSVVIPVRRTNVLNARNSRVIRRPPITEHVFSFTFHRSKIPQSIYPRPGVSQRGRNAIPRFHGDRIDSQRNARIAALEHYMDATSKRSIPNKFDNKVPNRVDLRAHAPSKDHMGLLSAKRSYTKVTERNVRIAPKETLTKRSPSTETPRNEHAPAKKRSMDYVTKKSVTDSVTKKSVTDSVTKKSATDSVTKKSATDPVTKKSATDSVTKKSVTDSVTKKAFTDSVKKSITKEANLVNRLFEKGLSHEIHKLDIQDSSSLKRAKTHSATKKQRFLIPKLIPTQITKSQIPNYAELNWKNPMQASPSGGHDMNKVKKSFVKTNNVTIDMISNVNIIPSTSEAYYHTASNLDINHEVSSNIQVKSNPMEADDDPFRGDAVAPSKKETVTQVIQVNEENTHNNAMDSGIVDDNASKKHLTESPHGMITRSNTVNDKAARKRYRQLGISSEFMDMKNSGHNIVNDDIDDHEMTRQNNNNDNEIVGKSRLNKYANKKNGESQLRFNTNSNTNYNNNYNNNSTNNYYYNANNNVAEVPKINNNSYISNNNNNKENVEASRLTNTKEYIKENGETPRLTNAKEYIKENAETPRLTNTKDYNKVNTEASKLTNTKDYSKENTEASKLTDTKDYSKENTEASKLTNTNTDNVLGSKLKGASKQKGVAESHDIKTRVDKAEFKNSSGHEIKLLTPSKMKDTTSMLTTSTENSKPYYMKEQKSKDANDDDDCTAEAQRKGECISEMRKPPVVNNAHNQLGIAHGHNQPAMGEMAPMNAKAAQAQAQAAQCACQGKVDCSCESAPVPAPTPAVMKPVNTECTCEKTAPDCTCPPVAKPVAVVAPAEAPEPEAPLTNECAGHHPCPPKPSHTDVDVVSIVKPSNVSTVCTDEHNEDPSCHHGKGAEPEVTVNANECAGQTTPCTCAPNVPCTCNPNCGFAGASSGPSSSPAESLAMSAPVKKPACCPTADGCPTGSVVCEPVKAVAPVVPSPKPSVTAASVTPSSCSDSCPHEHPTCVPCPGASGVTSKGSAAWLPLSSSSVSSPTSSFASDHESPTDSLSSSSESADMGKVNMGNFDCQGNDTNAVTRDTLCATFGFDNNEGVAQGSQDNTRNYAFVEDLPNVKGILASSFSKKKYNFRSCEFLATANKNGVEVRLHPTPSCSQISFSSLIQQLLGGEYDLAGPSDNLIVIGKFDAVGFNIDKIRERISFSLQCKELMDIIPNKLRISSGKVLLNFSYDSLPKSISDFVIKIEGLIHLNYRSRVLNINVDKAIDSTLFMIDMQARDLELPEFTKLFTQTEILQDDLPSDLATLVTSSLRNPRISGLYDSGGAFEFVASAKSPPSIFPLQPMVYVIIQKPRLGKVVSGMIVNFERAMYKTLLSSILDKDLSSIPLFKDIRTDLAIGVSTDGLYVIKDAMFNKEVGSLFDSGKPIKKGLTFKAKLPIGKMINDVKDNSTVGNIGINMGSGSRAAVGGTNEGVPENVLIDCEVTGNKMHLQFPEGLSLSLMNVGGFFGEEGQDMNFPTVSGELGRNVLSIKNYEVDNIEKKSVTVSFISDTPMKIGSLMTLGNVEANLKRDEYAKWSFVSTGDYQLGDTSVSVSLTSESDGFLISSKPSSIRSLLLVDVLDKTEEILKSELQMYHMDDFVIEDFRISGSLKSSNIIRFAGKPALFGVETSVIEFVATQEDSGNDLLAMGLLFENVNLDKVFGRMLDRNLLRRSWAVGTNIGLFVSSSKTATDLRFEMGGLAKTRIQPGNHLRVLLLRPEPTACKGDSLCKVLSAEMPIGSAFLLDGYMVDGTLKLSETIKDPLVLSKSLVLKNVALKMRIKDSVEIYVTGGLTLPNVDGVGFTGELRVDNTGHLQLKMLGNDTWRHPFGLKNVGFFNTTLSAAFEPGFPVPTMDVHGDISIGTEPLDTLKSLLGPVNVKINSGPNGRNTFTAKIKDLNFERLAMATGSKRTLLNFQKQAVFLDDAVLTYGPIKNEVTKEVTTRDTTPSEPVRDKSDDDENESANEKSEIKLTGRMRVLGSLSDYTMKFLQDGTQLLAEVQMPDIGVNHGELTIKAGLKRHSVHSDPQSPKGPTLLIRMDPTMNSGIIVGRISALGFSRLSAIKVEDEGYSSMMFGQLPGNHSTNVTLHSMYESNLEDANFQISACLPVQKPVREALMNYLQDKASLTKKTLVAGEDRVQKTEDIFKKTSSNIKNYEDVANLFLQEMRMKGDQLVKLKEELKRRCVPDCGESCMGLPTWKPSGISLNGRDAIGAPSWSPCNRKIPDLSCIVRCLGEKVIGNVRANRKQVELQGLISSLAETKNIIRTNRMYDARARNLVNSTASGLNKIKNTIQVGSDIANFMGAKDNNIQINNICFQDSLDNAERSLVNFEATTNINGQEKKMVIPSTLDGNTEYNIAEGIANTIFPGFFDFNKNLEQVKVLFSNLDGERDEIEKLMGKTNELMEKSTVEVRSEVDWNPEEIEFRKLAFGELPRFTLSDDETMHAFDDQSLWNIAPQNDPLFTKLKEDTSRNENRSAFSAFAKEFASGTPCDQLKRSLNHYGDVINALTEFTKKFLQERNIFRRQKNHRLADLRMIDDQIKSDCFIENCTMEDMDNALSYLGKAKYGLLRWANVIENQIEDQNKVALSYFSKRAGDIVEVSQGLSLRRYIVNVKSIASSAIKRTSIPEKEAVENDIKEIGKEMYHLLIGVKNSDELSTASPKIFRLKRQIQMLDHSRNLCANVSDTSLDSLDEFPSKDGTDYSAKQQVVKENFMNSKFLSHKDIDDDIVSPIIKENELDDDDDEGTKPENNNENNNSEEINYAIESNENNEANTEAKSAPAVAGEQRDMLAKNHDQKLEPHFKSSDGDTTKENVAPKSDTSNASVKSETHPDKVTTPPSNSTSSDTSASSNGQHHSKEERLMSEFKMINDDVLSFNNDLSLDLPEKRATP